MKKVRNIQKLKIGDIVVIKSRRWGRFLTMHNLDRKVDNLFRVVDISYHNHTMMSTSTTIIFHWIPPEILTHYEHLPEWRYFNSKNKR